MAREYKVAGIRVTPNKIEDRFIKAKEEDTQRVYIRMAYGTGQALSLEEAQELGSALIAVAHHIEQVAEEDRVKLPTKTAAVIKFPGTVPFFLTSDGWQSTSGKNVYSAGELIKRYGSYGDYTVLFEGQH